MERVERAPNWNTNGKRCGFLYNVVVTNVKASVDLKRSVELKKTIKQSSSQIRDEKDSDNFYSNKTSLSAENQYNSALTLHFVSEDGAEWSTSLIYSPYFYIAVLREELMDIALQFLYNNFRSHSIGPVLLEPCRRIDLSLPNHLEKVDPVEGVSKHNLAKLIKISFKTIDQLERGRDMITSLKRQFEKDNQINESKNEYDEFDEDVFSSNYQSKTQYDNFNTVSKDSEITVEGMGLSKKYASNSVLRIIGELYEHDVLYINRVCIDLGIRCGTWYEVRREDFNVSVTPLEKTSVPPLNVFAWDIECYKPPLKFPDMETDEIMLISVMFNGQGYLIVNRTIVSKDIAEFLYQPREDIVGNACFKIYNERTERDLLMRFFYLINYLKPHIFVTYNGDNFDFPYVNRRAEINGIHMNKVSGLHLSSELFQHAAILNMDCYKWVERDSYLPFGSRTLKQVCKLMLKYNPVEIDPEDMVHLARVTPQKLAVYSVSDAVATYHLYMKFIHNFILALSYIVPLAPNEVLRQGAGTLCENLLMAQAYANNILFPNKHIQKAIRFYTNPETERQHLVYENTYIGGRVESLRCGIFRDDQAENFELSSSTYDDLINNLENSLIYWAKHSKIINNIDEIDIISETPMKTNNPMEIDNSMETDNPVRTENSVGIPSERLRRIFSRFDNFEQVYKELCVRLGRLRDEPNVRTYPRIYHLDVGAMYPNIIITQRLQPTAIVDEKFCEKCSYYSESERCQKRMRWKQRLEISPIDKSQILVVMQNLKARTYQPSEIPYQHREETFEDSEVDSDTQESELKPKVRTWEQLTEREKGAHLQRAVKACSQKIFKKTRIYKEADVESIICQRENHFYVQTVQTFRDRRYAFKHLKKEGENELKELIKNGCNDPVLIKSVREKILINDSLQLAYKCILNSFYGYVKRTGSRWYSMEMGAIVTYTGASIIDSARKLIEKIGIPIELDTDGIWCMLPDIFPAVLDLTYTVNTPEGEKKKSVELEYMTTVLNMLIAEEWTNEQYLDLEESGRYVTVQKNEIFFELDGPWHAMFLPASEKSEELLKKRYVVYNHNGQIVELKGFEIKRRSEMRMIQLFQEDIFPQYLMGQTKEQAYQNAAKVAISYRKILDTRASDLADDDLFDLLLSKKTVRKPVIEQPHQKCFGITSARRLSELFKNDSYLNDANLSMSFLLASQPTDAPRTARAIPIQTFKVDKTVRSQFLAKWLKIQLSTAMRMSSRDILDWNYYKERIDTQILKLVVLPAIMQGLINPIPQVELPKWVKRKQSILDNKHHTISSYFNTITQNIINTNHTVKNIENEIVDDVIDWLEELKKKWIKSVINFKNIQKNTFNKINYNLHKELKSKLLNGKSHGLDFDDYYSLFTETWHIIDFTLDPHECGYLNCKVSIYNKPVILNVRIELWRKLYVNSNSKLQFTTNTNTNGATGTTNGTNTTNTNGINMKEVYMKEIKDNYFLPRGVNQMKLIELEMKESYFIKHLKNSINSILHKTIEGVYESKIPVTFDFISKIGTIINIRNYTPNNVLSEGLEFKSNSISSNISLQTVDLNYLSDFNITFVHIFHSIDNDTKRRNRIYVGIYNRGEHYVNKIYIGGPIVLKKYNEEQFSNISLPILEKYKQKWINSNDIIGQYMNPYIFPDCFGYDYTIDIEGLDASSTACKNILKKVDSYLNSLRPSISKKKHFLYIYSSIDKSELGEWSKGEYYPVYFDPIGKSHPQILSNLFLKSSFEESISLLSKQFSIFEEKLSLSRISAIPIFVLLSLNTLDTFKCLFDIMYSRALRISNTILWGTNESGVDLGIIHLNNTHCDYDIQENENNFDFTLPGIYRSYGAKITFNQSIMYNAILLESKMNDYNNFEQNSNKNEHEIDLHSSIFHPNSFKILGTMLENLMNLTNLVYQKVDYVTFQNIVNMCSYLKSWLSDPTSILYDPALYSMVSYTKPAMVGTRQYLVRLMKQLLIKHKLKTIHVDPTYIIVQSDCISITKGRTRIEEALNDLASNQSKFKNTPFYVEEEYVAMVQIDKNNYIRYKNYVDASKENCTENLKVLEFMPLAVEMFIRYFMKTITLDPLWRSLKSYYEDKNSETSSDSIEPLNLVRTDFQRILKKIQDMIIHDWHQPGSYFSRLYDLISDTETFAKTFDKNNKLVKIEFPRLPGTTLSDSDDWRLVTINLLLHIMKIDKSLDWTNFSLISSFDVCYT
ncbi:DNA polymerase epsilon (catalytic subunit), putative [Theileria annulata]|uniref:DNA polymerase epsilon catalytic subunit n=1 Tax=Theileria annulata TaxID=5874 RepID=Q4U8N2_THEAN|nr:DNA polymerase epsilon (catalytic subunit), putative [Theileria annulata]CAI76821.1 DNA polymerase epsilon (catalytic subunit), putative [Theileria annulata]|eukprot:XP_953446.1 DNA polymerase epsilon (catalytic subunit), putative [Theileria annulata]